MAKANYEGDITTFAELEAFVEQFARKNKKSKINKYFDELKTDLSKASIS